MAAKPVVMRIVKKHPERRSPLGMRRARAAWRQAYADRDAAHSGEKGESTGSMMGVGDLIVSGPRQRLFVVKTTLSFVSGRRRRQVTIFSMSDGK